MPRYWIVTCPEPKVIGGVWLKWFDQRIVAVGWPPSKGFDLTGGETTDGWPWARGPLARMRNGDKVIPFLLEWRIAPVGTVTNIRIRNDQWEPTVARGEYAYDPDYAELGRRIQVEWEAEGMPPRSKVAVVPPHLRSNRPLARHTIEELSEERYARLVRVLKDPDARTGLFQTRARPIFGPPG